MEQLHAILLELCDGCESVRGVLACSALKRCYRDVLVDKGGSHDISSLCVFVLLHSEESLLKERLASRSEHFMPPALLRSQLGTLELPQQDELVIIPDISQSVDDITQHIVVSLKTMRVSLLEDIQ